MWIARADGWVEYWNESMKRYTGIYPRGDVGELAAVAIHPDDVAAVRERWHRAVARGEPFEQEMRLRRHDGSWRWFVARAEPYRDERGEIVRWFGTDTDIEDRKRAEQQLRFLADAGDLLAAPADASRLEVLARRATAEIADLVTLFIFDEAGVLQPVAIAHRDPMGELAWREARRQYPLREGDLAIHTVESGKPVLVERVPRGLLDRLARDERHRRMLEGFDVASVLFVPVAGRREIRGALQLANGPQSRRLDATDLRFAEILARRIAISLESAEIFERERRISATFQHAALPSTLPSIPGIALTAVYRAADSEAEIGGDWYDAVVLPDGRLLLGVGDVAGKGLAAAVQMATVRQSLRTAALQQPSPAQALAAAARALAIDSRAPFATAWLGILDPATRRLAYASAGHPHALVRDAGGRVRALADATHPPLGVEAGAREAVGETTLAEGATLVLYTDGLVEATQDVAAGERRLLDVVGRDAFGRSANAARFLVDGVLPARPRDDVAVLTATIGERTHWLFHSGDAITAHGARAQFLERLREEAEETSDFAAAELVFGELVGNVVRHAPGPIDIDLDWENGEAVLHVMDRGPHFTPHPQLPEQLAEGGRGVYLVAALGRAFDVEPLPVGNHVRVRLPVRRRGVLR